MITEADDTLEVVGIGDETRIRVGDPDISYTGRHRYELEYVLPDARVNTGVLALDVIGDEETLRTDRFEVVLTGFDFGTTACDTGPYGSFGGCELVRGDDGRYITVIEPWNRTMRSPSAVASTGSSTSTSRRHRRHPMRRAQASHRSAC